MRFVSSLKRALLLNFILAAVLPLILFALFTLTYVRDYLLEEVARDNRFLALRLQLADPPADLDSNQIGDVAFFKISANNLVFRLLSRSLYVGYDLQSRALRYYIGPSNLPMMRDRKEITITYQPRSGDALASN